jgi:tetratricopeptide (TPR) repeat protein
MRTQSCKFISFGAGVCLALCASQASAQGTASGGLANGGASTDMIEAMAQGTTLVSVHVVDQTGKVIAAAATIHLQRSGEIIDNIHGLASTAFDSTARSGLARIEGIPTGEYLMEVTAPGYKRSTQKLTVLGAYAKTEAFVKLSPFDGSGDSDVELDQPNAPILTTPMRRELDAVLSAMSSGKMQQAPPHLKNLLKHAPENPDAHFIAGYYDERTKDTAGAKTEYEQAVKLFPAHFSAQLSLGSLLLNQGDAAGAIPHLESALSVGPNSWRGHWLLAEAHLHADRNAEQAKFHAQRAIDVGKEKAVRAEITLAMAEAIGGDITGGQKRLEAFLKDHPTDPSAARAKEGLGILTEASKHSGSSEISLPSGKADDGMGDLEDVPPEAITTLPKGVDDFRPVVTEGVACEMPQVLAGAELRSREFVNALERFTAKENVVQDELDRSGTPKHSAHRSFNYVAALEHPRPNTIIMDELRDGSFGLDDIPGSLAMEGIPAVGVVFNEAYANDFNFTCEGLGEWKGQTAWQVRFEQKADRPSRIHGWMINNKIYPASMKGRAWLSADSYQLLHVETDLAEPIKPIKLEYQHMSIDYLPVAFPNKKSSLWLPASAQIFYKYRGHYGRQEHDFSDFTLFSVNTKDDPSKPKKK